MQWLAVGSIVISLIGLYYKREELTARYKEAEPLTSKNSDEVVQAFQKIYRNPPLTWPKMLQFDPGREFMGALTSDGKPKEIHSPRAHGNTPRPGYR